MLSREINKLLLVGLVAAALFVNGAGMVLAGPYYLDGERIAPGVKVLGTPVGNLTSAEAEAALAPLGRELSTRKLSLTWGEWCWAFTPGEIGIALDMAATVQEALAYGNSGNLLERVRARQKLIRRGWETEIHLAYGGQLLEDFFERIDREIEQAPLSARMEVEGDRVSVKPSRPGYALDRAATRNRILSALQDPDNATVAAAVTVVAPAVTQAHAAGLEDAVPLAIYTTWFRPTAYNRSHNIALGAEALQGWIVRPGGVFSFNRAVGPRTGDRGYREAPVISNNELVPGIGGGICQVSTTLYNAALLANLEVVERSNHSLPVAYVPPGRDATVVYDAIDLQFRNNRTESIFLWAEVEGGGLTVSIFGRPTGEQVRIYTTAHQSIPPTNTTRADSALPLGTTRVVTTGKAGCQVTVIREVKTDDGSVSTVVISRDTYRPQAGLVLVGTGRAREAMEREPEPLPSPAMEEAVSEPSPAEPSHREESNDNYSP